jgi:hypothetical protein
MPAIDLAFLHEFQAMYSTLHVVLKSDIQVHISTGCGISENFPRPFHHSDGHGNDTRGNYLSYYKFAS